jgi:hypothetical protein
VQEVVGMRGHPNVGQERSQIHVGRGQRDQQLTDILEWFDPVSPGSGDTTLTTSRTSKTFPLACRSVSRISSRRCQEALRYDPFAGAVFVFRNR